MLACLRRPQETMLLIDEIDRSDHEFEAFLPNSFRTSRFPFRNAEQSAHEAGGDSHLQPHAWMHEALRRRCVYHWIEYPMPEREMRIIMMRASGFSRAAARAVVAAVGRLRREPLAKLPGIAEAVEWAEAATLLNEQGARWPMPSAARSVSCSRMKTISFISAADRGDTHGGAGMIDPARPIAHFLGFTARLRPRASLSHRAIDRLAQRDRAARPAGDRRHPPRRARHARATAGTFRRMTPCSMRISSARPCPVWKANRARRSR